MVRPITIAFAGDVMLGRLVDPVVAERGPRYPWGNVRPELERADAVVINLECALTTQTRKWTDGTAKAFYFRADPVRAVACLSAAHVTVASLANNHAGDFGPAGMRETVEVLDRAGIGHAGAGTDLTAAQAAAIRDVAGNRVAVLAFADYPEEWAATPVSPGINYLPIPPRPALFTVVERAIAAARREADLVICSLHWGPNMRARPSAAFRAFAHRLIEAGTDVIFGHSAHVVQGIESWRGKPILYDTGDFVDDYAVDPDLRNDLSALFLLRIAPPAIERLELLPVRIEHCHVNRAQGVERAWFARRASELCAELGTAVRDDGQCLQVLL